MCQISFRAKLSPATYRTKIQDGRSHLCKLNQTSRYFGYKVRLDSKLAKIHLECYICLLGANRALLRNSEQEAKH